jgi:predicted nucleic acid-binding protein
MPRIRDLVINTGPIIAIIAALNDLRVLQILYRRVLVPLEVCREITAKGSAAFAVAQFDEARWLTRYPHALEISPILMNSLDLGEAAVIQLALNEGISTVCIDESAGRRIARLNNLSLTGSIGILLRAKKEGYPISIRQAIDQMKIIGIRLSEHVINFALAQSGESD